MVFEFLNDARWYVWKNIFRERNIIEAEIVLWKSDLWMIDDINIENRNSQSGEYVITYYN